MLAAPAPAVPQTKVVVIKAINKKLTHDVSSAYPEGTRPMFSFYEFFAGGGMARLGLGGNWRCVFANDIDERKASAYRNNFDDAPELIQCDVAEIRTAHLPGIADLSWASFPCQDLSLAGDGAGLEGKRSGTFWLFWRLMQDLAQEGRAPRLVVLENVYGALTSHGGKDFLAIAQALTTTGYQFGALVIDAVHFVPQSRPRLFIVGVRADIGIPERMVSSIPIDLWHPGAVRNRVAEFDSATATRWIWWRAPPPPRRQRVFSDLIEDEPQGVNWHRPEETHRLLGMMTPVNLAKVHAAQATGQRLIGGVYKRMREGKQRAEVRFDDLSGCLRTPVGGSSRQTILMIEGDEIRSRLLSPREAARLMGLPETYRLPKKYNDAYHLAGDGLVAPVVRHLAETLLEPVLQSTRAGVPERQLEYDEFAS